MNQYKEKFYDNIKIDNCYGSFPCIWNGGRYVDGFFDYDKMVATLEPFKDLNIPVRYTFTNKFITEKDLNDRAGNAILEYTSKNLKNCSVTVASDLMKDFIEKNYPDLYTVWSTTLAIDDIDKLNELSEKNIVVPFYSINNNFDKLKQLKHPENIEILIAEGCVDNCPNRVVHHTRLSESQMYMEHSNKQFSSCPYQLTRYFYESVPLRKHYISIESINNDYLPLGFNKFKISGRNEKFISVIERYVHWLVKPDYRDDIRNKLLMTVINQ